MTLKHLTSFACAATYIILTAQAWVKFDKMSVCLGAIKIV